MKSEDIVNILKANYTRDLRKKVVKNILRYEKDGDNIALKSSYKLLNQIFSYVLSELNWTIASNTNEWDNTPLKIISEAFPKIETTRWYENQQLRVSNSIKLEDKTK